MIFTKNLRIILPIRLTITCLMLTVFTACRSERVVRDNPLGDAREVNEVLTGYYIADKECVKGEGLKSFQALVGRKWNGRNLEIQPISGINFSASRSLAGGVIAETFINLHQYSACVGANDNFGGDNFSGENCSTEANVVAKPVPFPICQDSYLFPRQSYESVAITSAISIDEANRFYKSLENSDLPKVSLIVLPVLEKRTILSSGAEDRKFQMDNLAFVDSFIDKPAFIVYPTSSSKQPGDNENALNLWESSWTLGHEFGHLVLASISGVKKSSLILDSSHLLSVERAPDSTAGILASSVKKNYMSIHQNNAFKFLSPFLDLGIFSNLYYQIIWKSIPSSGELPKNLSVSEHFSVKNGDYFFANESSVRIHNLDKSNSFTSFVDNRSPLSIQESSSLLNLQEARSISNQEIWSAINEGFADLYATAMSGGSELTTGVPCISQSRNPDYAFFQTGEAKVINEHVLTQFFSNQRLLPSPNCAAPFLQSPHTLGAMIAYGLRGLSLSRGDDSIKFGKSLITWAKNLGDYVRNNPKLDFKDLVFEGVKAFGFLSNNIVYLNVNQCGHIFQSFPEFSKQWYQTGKLNCHGR